MSRIKKRVYNPFKYMLACERCEYRKTASQVVVGSGHYKESKIMVIGEAPGQNEDIQGEPFVGRSGNLLFEETFAPLGFGREMFYITNIVKCRPPENEDPRQFAIAACSNHLYKQIEIVSPMVIVPIGRFSFNFFIKNEKISAANGRMFKWRHKLVIPMLHPAYILRNRGGKIENEFRQAARNVIDAYMAIEGAKSNLFKTRRLADG